MEHKLVKGIDMDHFFYELDECVRLDNIDGLYVITARKGRTEHNKKEKYYQIKGGGHRKASPYTRDELLVERR